MTNASMLVTAVVCGLIAAGTFFPPLQEAWQSGYVQGREVVFKAAKEVFPEKGDGNSAEQEAQPEAKRKTDQAAVAEQKQRAERDASQQQIRLLEKKLARQSAEALKAREESLLARERTVELAERVQAAERGKENAERAAKESAERQAKEAEALAQREREAQERAKELQAAIPKRAEPVYYSNECNRRTGPIRRFFGGLFGVFRCNR